MAAVIAGTTVATLGLNPGAHPADAAFQAAPTDRAQLRADRGQERVDPTVSASPSASPAASLSAVPSDSPSTRPPAQPSKTAGPATKPASGAGSGSCQASFYTDEGSRTASGEPFHTADFTAAHKTLPFNTKVRVTNVKNGKSVVVRINDRGPFVSGRCLDLTPAAFNTISSTSAGVATVRYEVIQG